MVRALNDETLLAAVAAGAETKAEIGTNKVATKIATKRFAVLIRHEVLIGPNSAKLLWKYSSSEEEKLSSKYSSLDADILWFRCRSKVDHKN